MIARLIFTLAVSATVSAVFRLSLRRQSVPLDKSLRWKPPKDIVVNDSIINGENETVYFDNFYVAEVGIGTPPQTAYLVMDTGSSNLWFMDIFCPCGSRVCNSSASSCSTTCPTQLCCDVPSYVDGCNSRTGLPPKKLIDTSKSTTYRPNGTTISCSYGIGYAQGPVGQDTCTVAGIEIKEQMFFSATIAALAFYGQPMSGIFGLGYQSLAVGNIAPPVINMINDGLIEEPIFSVWMEIAPSDTIGGEIIFGGVDPSKYSGEMYYVDVTKQAYWQYTLAGVHVGMSNYTTNGGYQAISDTGTSFIIGPTKVVEPIAHELGAIRNDQGLYVVECRKVSSLPNIYFEIGGRQFPIDSESYVIELDQIGCVLGMLAADMEEIDWILGDSFMRNWYHVFDFGKNRIGMAQAYQEEMTTIGAAKTVQYQTIYIMALVVLACIVKRL